MQRFSISLLLAAMLVLGVAVRASGQAFTQTEVGHFVAGVINDPANPCQPAVGESVTNFVEHVTVAPNGSVHFTRTEAGVFDLLDPSDANLVLEGRYTFWVGFNDNPNVTTFQLTLRANGTITDTSTGDSADFRFNLLIVENGEDAAFAQFNCHDGSGVIRVDL